ncbi:hypothetical protein PIB30_040193, partial [Stylosanthes scabra]|nr:hypothetical protein [Stylosanthes scabra]
MVRPNHVRLFESLLNEGKAYVISNVAIVSNDIKFKPTTHAYRLIFKKETRVYHIEDATIPLESFQFTPTSKILAETRDDGHLVVCGYAKLLSSSSRSSNMHRMGKPFSISFSLPKILLENGLTTMQ